MLIVERDRVREKLKRKRREDWTEEEVEEMKRTASRLSEFQSRGRWKKIVNELKESSEEQARQSDLQSMQISQLRAELKGIQDENALLRQYLSMQRPLTSASEMSLPEIGVPPVHLPSLPETAPLLNIHSLQPLRDAEGLPSSLQLTRDDTLVAALRQHLSSQDHLARNVLAFSNLLHDTQGFRAAHQNQERQTQRHATARDRPDDSVFRGPSLKDPPNENRDREGAL